ncbi:hypothetical protein K439DRAFT_1660371 [Ramaria rubella]|nr:hypothetical protein K439DRAFT_1660371 [Ramaria rubella]
MPEPHYYVHFYTPPPSLFVLARLPSIPYPSNSPAQSSITGSSVTASIGREWITANCVAGVSVGLPFVVALRHFGATWRGEKSEAYGGLRGSAAYSRWVPGLAQGGIRKLGPASLVHNVLGAAVHTSLCHWMDNKDGMACVVVIGTTKSDWW